MQSLTSQIDEIDKEFKASSNALNDFEEKYKVFFNNSDERLNEILQITHGLLNCSRRSISLAKQANSSYATRETHWDILQKACENDTNIKDHWNELMLLLKLSDPSGD